MRFNEGGSADPEKAIVEMQEMDEKMKLRAERFGTVIPEVEDEKKKARMERFGTKSKRDMKMEDKTQKEKREERFKADKLTPDEEEARNKRMARFGGDQVLDSLRDSKRIK